MEIENIEEYIYTGSVHYYHGLIDTVVDKFKTEENADQVETCKGVLKEEYSDTMKGLLLVSLNSKPIQRGGPQE